MVLGKKVVIFDWEWVEIRPIENNEKGWAENPTSVVTVPFLTGSLLG